MTTYIENKKYKALLRAIADYWIANGEESTLDRYLTGYAGRDWKTAIAEQREVRRQQHNDSEVTK